MGRLPPEDRRADLLEAALRVVARQGFARTRVADIADEAGVSVGLLHRYFPSLDDALAEAFAVMAERELEDLREQRDSSPRERLRRAITFEPADDVEWRIWVDAFGEALHRPALHATAERYNDRWRSELAAILADGAQAGDWRCDDPAESAARLLAAIDGVAVHFTLGGLPGGRAWANRWVEEIVARELGAASAVSDQPPTSS